MNKINYIKIIFFKLLNLKSYLLFRLNPILGIVSYSKTIPGWVSGKAAYHMAFLSSNMKNNANLVEVGVYMGRSSYLLSEPLRNKSGKLHCIDLFDCSGDDFSIGYYLRGLKSSGLQNLEEVFVENIRKFKLQDIIVVHKGSSKIISASWNEPIDLLLLDGDHSRKGAEDSYSEWEPFLRKGGYLILHNINSTKHDEDHNGNRLLLINKLVEPNFSKVYIIDNTAFAIKAI